VAGGATPVGADVNGDAVADDVLARVQFTRSGKTIELPHRQTILEGAEDNGIEVPFECRSGICGQCKTHLVSGRVTMDAEDALTAADRARGFILACQAHALTNVEVDA
jgi:ferredoxin